MKKAIVFDLDGTLLDTLSDLSNSVNHALEAFGYPTRTIDEVRKFLGNGVIKLMRRSAPSDISDENFEKCFQTFRSYYLEHMLDNTVPYDGIIELLEKLKKDGIKTAVVSNKLHSGVVGLCNDFFGDLIDCSFGVSDESERKPSPKNVEKALKFLNVSKRDAVYVGDSEVDFQTATNAKLDCICVTWGFRDEDFLKRQGAEKIVHNTEQLYNDLTSFY